MLFFTPCIYNAYYKGRIFIGDSALMTLYIAILSLTMMLMTYTCVNNKLLSSSSASSVGRMVRYYFALAYKMVKMSKSAFLLQMEVSQSEKLS